METEALLNFSCEMGRQLLQNGAEIYRVEESMHRVLNAYGLERPEVFAIPNCIIAASCSMRFSLRTMMSGALS